MNAGGSGRQWAPNQYFSRSIGASAARLWPKLLPVSRCRCEEMVQLAPHVGGESVFWKAALVLLSNGPLSVQATPIGRERRARWCGR